MATLHVDVVSTEESIFSGEASFGAAGRDGRARHLPAPHAADHPHQAVVGAHQARRQRRGRVHLRRGWHSRGATDRGDRARRHRIRARDLDEARAEEAKKLAEEKLKNARTDIDFALARSELAMMAAQLAALRRWLRK